jgi:plasmid stabilization system protein ParE
MRVRLSEEAREYLRTEGEYLRHRSPAAARRLLEKMRQARTYLGNFPMMGSASDEGPIPATRRLIVGEYVLTYQVSSELIEILAIRHGRMQAPSPDFDGDFDFETPL